MAKKNGTIRLVGLIVTLAVLFAAIVTAWAVYGEKVKSNAEAIESIKEDSEADLAELKEDGCKPANKATLNIALMQKDVKVMQKNIIVIQQSQAGMRTEQREGFEAILKRLPE